MAQRVIKSSGAVTHFTLVNGEFGWGTAAPDAKYHFVSTGGDADGLQNFVVEGSGRGSGITLRATGAGGKDISIYSGGTDHPGELVFVQNDDGVTLERVNFEGYYWDTAVLPADENGIPQAPDAPPDGYIRRFLRDDGNGNVEVCVLFPNGQLDTTHVQTFLKSDFTADVTSGAAPLAVTFTNTSTNTIGTPTFHWEKNPGDAWVDFDGTPTVENPTETFAVGTWSVRLTVTRADGDNAEVKHGFITATEPPPPGPGGVAGLIRAARCSDLVKPDGAKISKVPAAYETSSTFTSDGTRRPIFHIDRTPANGPSLTFDGVNDILQFTSTGALTEFHVFMVFKHTDLGSGNQAMLSGPVSSVLSVWQSTSATSDSVVSDTTESGSITFGGSPRDSDWHVYELKVDGGVATRKVDGVVTGTTPTIAGTQSYTFAAIMDWILGGAACEGEWAETCIYNVALSDGDADDVRADLQTDHGTP